MVERLKAMREPIGWMLFVLILLGWVVGFTQMAITVSNEGSLFAAFKSLGNSMMSLLMVGLLVAVVLSCVFVEPMTFRVQRLVRWSAWILLVGAVLTLVSTLTGLVANMSAFSAALEFLGAFVDVLLKFIAAVVLFLVDRAVQRHILEYGAITPVPKLGELELIP